MPLNPTECFIYNKHTGNSDTSAQVIHEVEREVQTEMLRSIFQNAVMNTTIAAGISIHGAAHFFWVLVDNELILVSTDVSTPLRKLRNENRLPVDERRARGQELLASTSIGANIVMKYSTKDIVMLPLYRLQKIPSKFTQTGAQYTIRIFTNATKETIIVTQLKRRNSDKEWKFLKGSGFPNNETGMNCGKST